MSSKGARASGGSLRIHRTLAGRASESSQAHTAWPDNGFLLVTIASVVYLLFALAYNARLLETASVGGSLVDLQFVENFGTVLAGAGVSLLAWRLQQRFLRANHSWPLVACIVVSVPLTWGLQETATRLLVSNATPSELRSSYVASLGTEGLRNGPGKLKNAQWLTDGQHEYDVKTFFALFPALAKYDTGLVAAIETELPTLVRHTVEQREGSVETRFRDYENEEIRFHRIYNESYALPAQRTPNPKATGRPEIESTGPTDGSALPGVPASLLAGLSWAQFSKRDDVREAFARRTGYHADAGQFLDFGMQRNEFVQRVYEPTIRLRETDLLQPLNTAAGFEPGSASRERGIAAYRTAIEPAVGLVFSFFFALLNAGVLVASIVFRSLPTPTSAK